MTISITYDYSKLLQALRPLFCAPTFCGMKKKRKIIGKPSRPSSWRTSSKQGLWTNGRTKKKIYNRSRKTDTQIEKGLAMYVDLSSYLKLTANSISTLSWKYCLFRNYKLNCSLKHKKYIHLTRNLRQCHNKIKKLISKQR